MNKVNNNNKEKNKIKMQINNKLISTGNLISFFNNLTKIYYYYNLKK